MGQFFSSSFAPSPEALELNVVEEESLFSPDLI